MAAARVSFAVTLCPPAKGEVCRIFIPEDAIRALGSGRCPKVIVAINGHSYRTTVSRMTGNPAVPLNKANMAAAGLTGREALTLTMTLDTESRVVEIDDDIRSALLGAGLLDVFTRMPPSHQREYLTHIVDAKKPETRLRRIDSMLTKLEQTHLGGAQNAKQ